MEKDPGITGKKLSKSDSDVKLEQRNRLFDKYLDAQIAWIRVPSEENELKYRKIGDEYKRQFDW